MTRARYGRMGRLKPLKWYRERNELSTRMVLLEQALHQHGLHVTARKLNAAVQQLGWELADQLGKEAKARRLCGVCGHSKERRAPLVDGSIRCSCRCHERSRA